MKKFEPNHNLFDNLDEKATYVLGFWLADGSICLHKIRNKYYKTFSLHNTDNQMIKDLELIVNHNSTIRKNRNPYIFNQTFRSKLKPSYTITIYSDKLFDFCYDITKSTRKSDKEIRLPDIPKKCFSHFIRGFFDGDGSICVKDYKTRHGKEISALQTSFTAGEDTGNFLENFKNKLREFIPIGDKKYQME